MVRLPLPLGGIADVAVKIETVPVIADEETYEANFVKVALNVMRRPDSEENTLPALLTAWCILGLNLTLNGTFENFRLSRFTCKSSDT